MTRLTATGISDGARRGDTLLIGAVLLALAACERPATDDVAAPDDAERVRIERTLATELARIRERADSIDAIFQPLPLLRPAEEAAMRRYLNPQQLPAARRLGIPPNTPAGELERMVAAGRLVRLPDSTALWVVRELDYSVPLVTPAAEALLREIGERFQAELRAIDVPAYRVEVTSVLRSAEDQERLRRVNPNAAAGESTHMFGTTFDLAYSAFAPPAEPIVAIDAGAEAWLEPYLETYAAGMAEIVAARRSRELMAILGRVLLELQNEGKVMLTLERLQPVFHMTVARALAN